MREARRNSNPGRRVLWDAHIERAAGRQPLMHRRNYEPRMPRCHMELVVIVAVMVLLVGLAVFVEPNARGQPSRDRRPVPPKPPPASIDPAPDAAPKRTTGAKRRPKESVPQASLFDRLTAGLDPGPNDPITFDPLSIPMVQPEPRRPMGTEFRVDTVVRCLAYLRYALTGTWSGVLEPFDVDAASAVDVVRATNHIAAHLGTTRVLYIVAVGHLDPKLGGLIELRRGATEVYIDVSTTASRFAPSLLAVLGHELCHKLMSDRGIDQQGADTHAFEVLTDVTAVYMGLGKILLNGYEFAGTIRGASGHVWTHQRFGYLSIDEIAFAHAMACRIRRHPWAGWSRGLSPFARRAVSRIESNMEIRHHLDAAPKLTPRPSYLA